MSSLREDKRHLQIDCKQLGITYSNLDVPEHEDTHAYNICINGKKKHSRIWEEKQIGEVDLFRHESEPALEDNQFRLVTGEAVLKKSIAIVDTGLSVEKENTQDNNVDTLQEFSCIFNIYIQTKQKN